MSKKHEVFESGYVATRFGGLGIHQSVATGEIMADLIADGEAKPAGVVDDLTYGC